MLFATEADKEAPGEVVEARTEVQDLGVGVKAEADRKIVGEEVVAAVEIDSKYPGLIQSQRKRASQQTTDSHNPIDVPLFLRKGNGIL
jgi:hypothetical protein